MARRASTPGTGQGHLFGGEGDGSVAPAPPSPAAATLAPALPGSVRMGTSSWTFPGWKGLLYDGSYSAHALAAGGLRAYAAHPLMRTVGLDRAFYAVLPAQEYRDLQAQLAAAPAFRFLIKAHQASTRPLADEKGRTYGDTAQANTPNPMFLDPAWAADNIVAPMLAGLTTARGPVLFQFPPLDLRHRAVGGVARLLDRLEAFLLALPAGAQYAVEVRNRAVLCERYAAALARGNAAHGFVLHPSMPGLGEQAAGSGWSPSPSRPLVVRWLLRPELTYEGAKDRYEPFNKVVDPDDASLDAIAALVRRQVTVGGEAYVIVNNKAEGSAPLSVERIAARLVQRAGHTGQ